MSVLAKAQKTGVLIAFEGIDGSGKSTQVAAVAAKLVTDLRQVLITRWNSSPFFHPALVEAKRQMALTPRTYALGHCTDFADRYDRQICPALATGAIVLADRYCYTAYARDAARGCDPGWVRGLYQFAQMPDLVLYIDTPPQVAFARIQAAHRQPKPYEAGMDLGLSRDLETSFLIYQARVRANYQDMAKRYRFAVIDGGQDPDAITAGVWAAVCQVKGVC